MEKEKQYIILLEQLKALTEGVGYVTTNLANTAALLYQSLPELNWVGFYLMADGALQLGPFCGKTACIRIPLSKGVCGAAATQQQAVVVDDVHLFPGHIACDSASASEIVLPILENGVLYGVLDIDSPRLARFDEIDRRYLEQVVQTLMQTCDFQNYILR